MKSFYFYDLETSSANPRTGRIMQFAGQRTNENLEPIGEPDNILVKLADDVLPEPDAILVHRITPQKTLEEGLTEAEFAEYFQTKVATAGTVFVGFNNIRFDDEFTRYLCYRNFHDPYQWHWKDDRSRWDLLDAIRMMRALRPDGMKWPFIDGKPSVKLELMAKENGLLHENAHDALSDVVALIELAQKFKSAQPKLFEFLVANRDKKSVARIAEKDEAFVYTSGRLSSEHEKTTVVKTLFKHPRRDSAIVYDLREDPTQWFDASAEKIAKHWQARYGSDLEKLPIKIMQYNKCPAIAPVSVLDEAAQKRISIDMAKVSEHASKLKENPAFIDKVIKALDIVENKQQSSLELDDDVDTQLYDGFWSFGDQSEILKIRMADPDDFGSILKNVKNKRLREMMPRYKARNYSKMLSSEERAAWDEWRAKKLNAKLPKFSQRMQEISKTRKLTSDDQYLLTELQLYVQSILPEPAEPEEPA